jgi:hypothetical protein
MRFPARTAAYNRAFPETADDSKYFMRTDIERFFSPKSIAIIGASQDLITISGQPLKHLLSHGYKGKLYPIRSTRTFPA